MTFPAIPPALLISPGIRTGRKFSLWRVFFARIANRPGSSPGRAFARKCLAAVFPGQSRDDDSACPAQPLTPVMARGPSNLLPPASASAGVRMIDRGYVALALGFDWSLFARGIAASFEGIKR